VHRLLSGVLRPSPRLHKVSTRCNKVSPRTSQMARVVCEGADWIHLAPARNKWRTVANTAMDYYYYYYYYYYCCCCYYYYYYYNYYNSVGIALVYGLDDRGSRVRFSAGAGNFSLHHHVQNGSGAHPASYPMGTRSSFTWG
jgi:hypothetical protein